MLHHHELKTHQETAKSISTMIVRGAGAIGATGAFGMAQAALEAPASDFEAYMSKAAELMKNTRPTAQNLFYGIQRVMSAIQRSSSVSEAKQAAVAAAQAVADEDAQACKQIGSNGAHSFGKTPIFNVLQRWMARLCRLGLGSSTRLYCS